MPLGRGAYRSVDSSEAWVKISSELYQHLLSGIKQAPHSL